MQTTEKKLQTVSRSWFIVNMVSAGETEPTLDFYADWAVFFFFLILSFCMLFAVAFTPEPDLWPTFSSALQRSLNQALLYVCVDMRQGKEKFLFYQIIFHLIALDLFGVVPFFVCCHEWVLPIGVFWAFCCFSILGIEIAFSRLGLQIWLDFGLHISGHLI